MPPMAMANYQLPNEAHVRAGPTPTPSAGGDWWSQNAPSQAASPSGSAPPPTSGTGYSFPIPPGFDPANPADKLVLDNFEKYKDRAAAGDPGAQPTAANMSYWRDQINQHGGVGDASKAQYWNERMTPGGAGGGGGGGGGGYGFGSFGERPATFEAPTDVTQQNDPGFQFRMKEGQRAIENAAAAKGSILSGGTQKAIERYGQEYGSGEFGNVYQRALTGYLTNVGTQRSAQQDYWGRLQDLYQGGLGASGRTYQRP